MGRKTGSVSGSTEPAQEPAAPVAEVNEWYAGLREYLLSGTLPPGDKFQQRMFMTKANPYTLILGVLYKLGPDEKFRRCVTKEESLRVMHTFHSGEEGGTFWS